jgi:hypothetical protein
MNLTVDEIRMIEYLLDEHIRDCKLKVEIFSKHLDYTEEVRGRKLQIKICKNIRQKLEKL